MTDHSIVDALLRALLFSLVALAWVVMLVRVSGVRSLSKMTAFDFVVTLATGSLLASAAAAAGWVGFVQSVGAMTTLMAAQVGLAYARRNFGVRRMLENEPLLLMRDGAFIDRALREGRMTRDDLRAKLRQADIADPCTVAFMVLETTGDIAILTHQDLGDQMMAGVRGAG